MISAYRRRLRRWAFHIADPRGKNGLGDGLRLRAWDARALAKGTPLRRAVRAGGGVAPAAPPATRRQADFFRDHLLDNVIPFWTQSSIDEEHGGFLIHLDRAGRVLSTRKHSAMQARTVYAFSLAHHLDPRPEYLAVAAHGAQFLREQLWDRTHGGWYGSVERDGEVLEADKPIISQAYALIGLITYHHASGDAASLGHAEEALHLLEKHAWDPAHGGYYDRCERDWTVASDLKTAAVHNDMFAAMMLASSTLGDRRYEERLIDVADILARDLSIGRPPRIGGYVRRDLTYMPSATGDVIDAGQGLKAAALLAEASRQTGRSQDLAHAEQLIEFYLSNAWDPVHGGFLTRLFRGGRVASDEKLWWTQCEGIVSLAALTALTGNEDYRAYLDQLVDFCVKHLIDEAGEWYTSCAPDGRVRDDRKGNTWKGPYHSARVGFYGWLYLSDREVGPPGRAPSKSRAT